MKYKNTLQKGSVRFIIFKEKNVWYGAGLEFNVVESGSTPQEAMLLLFEALRGYVEAAKKIKARPNILNQRIDPEYERMWKYLAEAKGKQKEWKPIRLLLKGISEAKSVFLEKSPMRQNIG